MIRLFLILGALAGASLPAHASDRARFFKPVERLALEMRGPTDAALSAVQDDALRGFLASAGLKLRPDAGGFRATLDGRNVALPGTWTEGRASLGFARVTAAAQAVGPDNDWARLSALRVTGLQAQFWSGGSVDLAASLHRDGAGRAQGQITLVVDGWSQVRPALALLRDPPPDAALAAVSALVAGDRAELTLSVRDGAVRLGPLTLGSIPDLPAR